ncbi:D-alanyl-D-alanine carboxypeptidase [Desulfosporosinus orientis DSM 765]|uniref:D-alanyl-D-alanine carboxypeptidase n=1 Tax=Desulfosporosinus orientis (strain ATCC 19365 / DSM 765 / NCIMB 8382 / VKM B-1628 / Singapore I) TaxID=768706 RepID=G7W956_DESOD|nr:serine hydrolase [Desulfosporosinus orientis]AET68697.1 D-alanyl-D-alanine carboxypeptidase [Desulfosporosinus orientis DSM 765]
MRQDRYSFSKPRSRAKFRKTKFIVLLLTIVVIGYAGYSYISSGKPAGDILAFLANKSSGIQTVDSQKNSQNSLPNSPQEGNSTDPDQWFDTLSTEDESYVLIDPSTQHLIYSHNPDLQRAPASTQKLLTGLVAMKTLKETDVVKVGNEVILEGSQLGLKPGDEISVHDLLTALYVHSANDAAAALAVKTSGSIEAFAEEMNKYAVSLGCQNSHFTNPHGLPDPNQYTSARDLSKIAGEFLKNEDLMKYVKQTKAHLQWKDGQGGLHEADVETTNHLLGIYPGSQGLKTGTTTAAGQCLVSYVSRADGDYLLVLLGSQQRFRDTIQLLDKAWEEERGSAALKGLAADPQSLLSSPGIF